MAKKIKKTLYIPDWIADLVDTEGEKYDGPGVVTAAAIWMFGKLPDKDKAKCYEDFRKEEISTALQVSSEAAQKELAKKKLKHA